MGRRGPLAETIPDTDEPRIKPALVQVYRDEWEQFQDKHGRGNVSARIRELVREDIKRG
jgi:hypothetical protein